VALGERRALSVRDYLINLGISSDRVTTTSFGELRPAQFGQNETAWEANRRAEFVLLLPKP
jgi:peptidoglycan-associated lipoprotein